MRDVFFRDEIDHNDRPICHGCQFCLVKGESGGYSGWGGSITLKSINPYY